MLRVVVRVIYDDAKDGPAARSYPRGWRLVPEFSLWHVRAPLQGPPRPCFIALPSSWSTMVDRRLSSLPQAAVLILIDMSGSSNRRSTPGYGRTVTGSSDRADQAVRREGLTSSPGWARDGRGLA